MLVNYAYNLLQVPLFMTLQDQLFCLPQSLGKF